MLKDITPVAVDLSEAVLRQKSSKAMTEFLAGIKSASPTLHVQTLIKLSEYASETRDDYGNVKSAEDLKMFGVADMPSPFSITSLVNSQLTDYTRGDLRKLAMEIKSGVPCASDSFHFVYSYITGGQ